MNILFYLMLAFGAFIFFASITNMDWYFKQRRAQTLIKIFGRNGVRVLYALLGLLFIVFSWLVINGNIDIG